jgi:DNA-binding GntR family transcriptional regulator
MAAQSAKRKPATTRKPATRSVRGSSRTARDDPGVPARKQPLSEVIARSLEEDIVLGRHHPREHLVEQDLCERFETHRGDVRLALFELEKKGIIQRIPNRGAIVRDLTPKEVREIYAVREELEVMAMRVLPLPVGKSDLDKLTEMQRRHSAAIDAGNLLEVFHSNLHFHQALFGLCSNTCLIEAIELLAQKAYGIRSYANAFPEALDQARRDHVDMIEALRNARRDDLIALARRHLRPSPEAYIRAYERRFGDARWPRPRVNDDPIQ